MLTIEHPSAQSPLPSMQENPNPNRKGLSIVLLGLSILGYSKNMADSVQDSF